MEMSSERRGQVTILTVAGSVDSSNADDLAARLAEHVDQGDTKIVMNCGELSYISSAGLRAILATAKSAEAASGELALAAPQPDVERVLKISGFSQLLKMHDDVDAAVAGLEG